MIRLRRVKFFFSLFVSWGLSFHHTPPPIMATSQGKDQNTHLRTAGVVQACHNFLISVIDIRQCSVLRRTSNLPKHAVCRRSTEVLQQNQTAQLYLKLLLMIPHPVPFINRSEPQNGPETEQSTANVQMSRSVGVV